MADHQPIPIQPIEQARLPCPIERSRGIDSHSLDIGEGGKFNRHYAPANKLSLIEAMWQCESQSCKPPMPLPGRSMH